MTIRTDPFERDASVAIELRDLTKVYGQARALDGVDLTVAAGSVFGFLGPNGAGKTTTLRILAGLAAPTAGQAGILGRNVVSAGNELRALIGYLPDVPAFYPWMTAFEFLHFTGELFGLAGKDVEQRIGALLDLAGLSAVTTRIGSYSRGMKQRLGVAQALMNAPQVLLLDEPTSALDPLGRKEVLDMIAALAGRTTVFFSTHILGDVERVCDTVAILDHGQVVREAPIGELKAGHGGGQRLLIAVDRPAPLVAALEGQSWLTRIESGDEAGELRLAVNDLAAAQRAVPAAVAAAGLALRRLEVDELSLEDVFVELVGERAAGNVSHPQS
ncbi:MAG: ABC transporter ATP-binding protein [Thermoleophilia bacterium]